MNDCLLFLDFDNTLVHTMLPNNEQQADMWLDLYGQYWEGAKFELNDGWYVSFVRHWSDNIIRYFQNKLTKDNVCILSWGTSEYVKTSVGALGLDIPTQNIYAREDISTTNVPRFNDKNMVLVDNEPYLFHIEDRVNKIKFLKNLPPHKFVKVSSFNVNYLEDDSNVNEIIENIETSFNNKPETYI